MKVLLAVDGSSSAQEAVNEIARRTWPPATVIRVFSVVQTLPPSALEVVVVGSTLEELRRAQLAGAERLTASVAESLEPAGVSIETVVREGEPREQIVDEAAQWGADLIVVGSHGHTGLKRWLLGSVAQSVVSHAPCSVEVVRARRP